AKAEHGRRLVERARWMQHQHVHREHTRPADQPHRTVIHAGGATQIDVEIPECEGVDQGERAAHDLSTLQSMSDPLSGMLAALDLTDTGARTSEDIFTGPSLPTPIGRV